MKNTAKIRQHLKEMVIISNTEPCTAADTVYRDLAERILALLPCETCNGSKKKILFMPGQREFGGDASTAREIDCPNCQKKPVEDLLLDLQEAMCGNIDEPAGGGCGYGITEAGQLEMKKIVDRFVG